MARNPKSIRQAAGPDPISEAEAVRFADLEHRAGTGVLAFAESLAAILGDRLYRQGWSSWEIYLKDRWGISRAAGYQLVDLAKVRAIMSANADTLALPAPTPEIARALGPLLRVAPEAIVPTMIEAHRAAAPATPTAAAIRQVAERHAVPKPAPRPAPRPRAVAPVEDAYETDGEGRSVPRDDTPVAAPSALSGDPPSPGWLRFLDFAQYCEGKLPAALGQLAVREHGQDQLYRLRDFIDAAADEARRLA